jgi:hypothetical protein
VRARKFPLTTELREVLEQQLARSREIEKARSIVIARWHADQRFSVAFRRDEDGRT